MKGRYRDQRGPAEGMRASEEGEPRMREREGEREVEGK